MSDTGTMWTRVRGDGEDSQRLTSAVGVAKDECFHCSKNPEKFAPLPKEKQPYCTRCFESMFNFDINLNNNTDTYSPQPPASIPKPPTFKPPEVPPKPVGKNAILYSTLPQPFQPKSATPSISPVPSSTRSVSCTPPPSPPSESEQDRFYEGTNVDVSLPPPPPPPPLLETNLDSLESERNSQNSPCSSSSPSSSSGHVGTYSPRYYSPTPIQLNGHQDSDKSATKLKSASNHSLNSLTSPVLLRSSKSSAASNNDLTEQSSQNGNRKSLIGAGNMKFDYKLIAAVPSAMAEWRDPEEENKVRKNSGSSVSSVERDSVSSSKSYNHSRQGSSPILGQSTYRPVVTPSYTKPVAAPAPKPALSSPFVPPTAPPPPPAPAVVHERITTKTPGFQGIRPGVGAWTPSKPVISSTSTHGVRGIEPSHKGPTVEVRSMTYEPASKPNGGGVRSTLTESKPAPPVVNAQRPAGGIRTQTSVEPEETHLDQLNSIFKIGSMKPKAIDPYETPEDRRPNPPAPLPSTKPAVSGNKPSLKCAKCMCNLLGKTVQSNSKGELVCVPCFKNEQLQLAGCVKCGGAFTPDNHMVTYKAQGWHHSCFACDKCKKPIGTKTFCKQAEGLFCSDCYFETKGRICVKCKSYLKSAGFIFRNQPWHHECFLCHGCQKRLGDEEIYCKDEMPYCGPCYDQKFIEKCAKCFKVLHGETVEYEGKQFHDDCFCCYQCVKPIGSASFYPKEGQIYCDVCFTKKFAKTCKKCKLVIPPTHGAGLVYKEQHFHKECFNCTHCHKHLSNCMVHSTKSNDDPFCETCYDELFAKRCAACTNIISGVIGTRFMSFQGRHWHVECFNCKLCQTSLENRKFVPSQGNMLCIACSKFNPYSEIA